MPNAALPTPLEAPSTRALVQAWMSNSHVVDKQGKPLVCWHGSNAHAYSEGSIETFNTRPPSGRSAAFFTDTKELASQYGERLYAVCLKIERPLIIEAQGKSWVALNAETPIAGPVTSTLKQASQKAADDLTRVFQDMKELFDDEDEPGVARPKISADATQLTGRLLGDLPGLDGGDVETDGIVKAARRLGFDGVVFRQVLDSPTADPGYKRTTADVYAAFDASQILILPDALRDELLSRSSIIVAANQARAFLENVGQEPSLPRP